MRTDYEPRERSILEDLRATSQALVQAEEAQFDEAITDPRSERRGLLQRLT